jgi:hypothetical protein
MFTVKWCVQHKQGEVIRMFQVDEVIVASRNTQVPNEPPAAEWMVAGRFMRVGALVILDPHGVNGGGASLAHGVVYVMNSTGATVGKYYLSDEVIDYADQLPLPKDLAKAA